MSSRSLGKNFIWNASYQLLLVLLPLVTTPYLSRVLGAEQVGVYSYTYAVTNYFVMFATLGMAQHGVRAIAQAGADRELRSQTFWSAWAAQAIVAIPVTLVYFIYVAMGSTGGATIGLVWGCWVIGALLDVSWLFFGVEEFKMPTIRSAITKLAGVAVIFMFVHGPEDLWAYCLSIAGANLANSLLLIPFVKQHVDFVKPTWAQVKAHFLPNLKLFAPVVAISLYTSLDKIMLGAISGMEQAGYYEYSEKLSKMPMALITALGTVMLPHMTAKLAEGKKAEAVSLLGKCIWIMEAAAMGLAFGIAAITPEFVEVFFGPGYEPCVYVMPVVSVVIPIICASNVIGVQYMLPTCSDNDYTISVFVGAVVNIALNLVLLEPLGAVGAAIATVAAEVAVLLYQCWRVRVDLPLLSYLTGSLPFVALGAVMYVIVRALAVPLTAIFGVGWVLLALEVILGGFIYCVFAGVWCWKSGRFATIKSLFKRG